MSGSYILVICQFYQNVVGCGLVYRHAHIRFGLVFDPKPIGEKSNLELPAAFSGRLIHRKPAVFPTPAAGIGLS